MNKPDFEKEILALFPTYEDGAYSDENEGKRMAAQHVWDTHVVPLQEDNKQLMSDQDILANDLKNTLEREEALIESVIELESENKSLQEKLKIAEHLKELDDDAIVTLQKEVERLKAEVMKEKFPEN